MMNNTATQSTPTTTTAQLAITSDAPVPAPDMTSRINHALCEALDLAESEHAVAINTIRSAMTYERIAQHRLREATYLVATTVTCPTCHAAPGDRCAFKAIAVTPDMYVSHASRENAAHLYRRRP